MKILILILLCSVFGSFNGFSQTNNCDLCPGTQWSSQSVTPIDFINPQGRIGTALVTYRTRTCPGVPPNPPVSEIVIEKIEIVPPSDITGVTVEDIMGQAMTSLVKNNPMNFPPHNPQDNNMWRIIQKSCWKYTDNTKTELTPCSNCTECCATSIFVFHEICNTNDHKLVYQMIGEGGENDCKDELGHDGECVFICNPMRKLFATPNGNNTH